MQAFEGKEICINCKALCLNKSMQVTNNKTQCGFMKAYDNHLMFLHFKTSAAVLCGS